MFIFWPYESQFADLFLILPAIFKKIVCFINSFFFFLKWVRLDPFLYTSADCIWNELLTYQAMVNLIFNSAMFQWYHLQSFDKTFRSTPGLFYFLLNVCTYRVQKLIYNWVQTSSYVSLNSKSSQKKLRLGNIYIFLDDGNAKSNGPASNSLSRG